VWIDARLGPPTLYAKRLRPGFAADSEEAPIYVPSVAEEILEFSLDATPAGQLYLAYTARGPSGDEVHWTRYIPSTGWTEPARLSGLDGYPSGTPDVRVQRDGRVRVVWKDAGPTRTTVRTSLFDPGVGEFLPTTDPLFVSPLSLSAVRFAGGPFQQDVLIARASETPSDRVLIGNRHTDGVWDAGLGSLSEGLEAGGHRIAAFVEEDGTTIAVWAGQVEGQGQVVVRTRPGTPASLVDVPAAEPRAGLPAVQAFPNPATRSRVQFTLAEGVAGAVAVYAPTGRRVALLESVGGVTHWDGRDGAGRLLPPGVYLYRVENEAGASRAGKLVWIP
ncbi:MAG: hypothetical protein ACREKH_19750, partial [Candidatus Rokuibacteriota bacterium]